MDKEDVVHIYNGILLSHQDEYLPFTSTWMELGGYYAKSIRERQLSPGFSHVWNICHSTEDHRGREGKLNGKKSERETNHERLWTPGTKLRVTEGRGWGDGVTE